MDFLELLNRVFYQKTMNGLPWPGYCDYGIGFCSDEKLTEWVDICIDFVMPLPPKEPGPKRDRKKSRG